MNEIKNNYVINLFKKKIEQCLNANQKISFHIISSFNFFDGIKRIYPQLKKLYENGLLLEFKVIIGEKNKFTFKEFYRELKKDSISLNKETFDFVKVLYDKKIFDFRIYAEKKLDVKLYILKIENNIEIWNGSAVFGEDLNRIELLSPVNTNLTSFNYIDFFTNLWKASITQLRSADLIGIIKKASYQESYYLNQRDFVSSMIKLMEKDYIVKNIGFDLSYTSEFKNMSYYICLDKLKNYGSAFLFNTAGVGKTDISCMVSKYYKDNDKRILIVHSPNDLNHWKLSIKKAGLKENDVEYISRLDLYKTDFNYENYLNSDLIIVSDIHLYINFGDEDNISLNIENLIKKNKNASCLFITDYPIISSFSDFIYFLELSIINNEKCVFNNIIQKIELAKEQINKKNFNDSTIKLLKEIILDFSVNIKSSDINTYFENHTVTNTEKPTITQVKYAYNHEICVKIYEKLVPFLSDLNLEYVKLWSKNAKNDRISYYKWKIYKKLESSIYSFRICLKNILDKNLFIKNLLLEGSSEETNLFQKQQLENIIKNYINMEQSLKENAINNINKDIKNIESTITNIEQIRYLENLDDKITNLLKILKTENKSTIIFSESKDTVLYIERRLKEYSNFKTILCYGNDVSFDNIDEDNKIVIDKFEVENSFNNTDTNILIATDILDENVIFSKAEIIVNFDMSYNTSILQQRNSKIKNINSKKTKIFNFQPDRRIDKEINVFETLNFSSEEIISIVGIDFATWLLNDKKIEDFTENNKQNIIFLSRDFKDFVAVRNLDDFQSKIFSKEISNNISLRKFIKYFNISEDTIKLSLESYKKPTYTSFKANENSYFIFYKYKGRIHSINNLIFSEENIETDLHLEELKNIEELIKKDIEKNQFLKLDTEQPDTEKIQLIGIIKYFND